MIILLLISLSSNGQENDPARHQQARPSAQPSQGQHQQYLSGLSLRCRGMPGSRSKPLLPWGASGDPAGADLAQACQAAASPRPSGKLVRCLASAQDPELPVSSNSLSAAASL